LLQPKPGDRICDPACGSGSLLVRVAKEVREPDNSPGREIDRLEADLAKTRKQMTAYLKELGYGA
jgi:type I restriction-modification system DNA methylase subunit